MAVITHNYVNTRLSILVVEEQKYSTTTAPRMSCTKHIERQIIHAWKVVTRATRKRQRASVVPRDFVLLTNRQSALLAL
ncbi:hypothetical protein BDN72DRAFT_892712 [Pluteus cervinus]|uniref:Uncharacterized protein n=1 Tax=Pluteus cervinus TaxID=181527 RepID=A0ACD3BBK7_9AGAR|nr:hypothetical protein BDN72DRAFT_892712 [Pluteus cervinus]